MQLTRKMTEQYTHGKATCCRRVSIKANDAPCRSASLTLANESYLALANGTIWKTLFMQFVGMSKAVDGMVAIGSIKSV